MCSYPKTLQFVTDKSRFSNANGKLNSSKTAGGGGIRKEDLSEATALRAGDEVLQGKLIKAGVKSYHGFGQGTLEATTGGDAAGVGGGIKTLNDGRLALGLAQKPTDENLLRQTGEKDATSSPASGLEVAEPGEILDNLRQMMTRDIISGGDFLNLKGTPLHSSEHEQSE